MHHCEKAQRCGRLILGRVGVVEIKVALMFGWRHSLKVTEGVRYVAHRRLETKGLDEVVDKDWSEDALGIFVIASHSVVFGEFDRDWFDGALDVSTREVDMVA